MMEIRNEMGVIVAFAAQAKEAGFEFVGIGAEYPDAIIRWKGQEYRVEFEFKSSNFYSHGHDVRDCDLIICWQNDCSDNTLPVLALSSPGWATKGFLPITQDQKEAAYWRRRAAALERQVQELNGKLGGLQALVADPSAKSTPSPVEVRQEKVSKMVADGFTNEQIAKALKVSLGTIKNDRKMIRQRQDDRTNEATTLGANRLMADPADTAMTTGGQNGKAH